MIPYLIQYNFESYVTLNEHVITKPGEVDESSQ